MSRRAALVRWAGLGALFLLLLALAYHALGVALDVRAALGFPFQIDYGEGIVWQQAALIPGPRAYGTSTALPFIVFHYPPVFYLAARAAAVVVPDLLTAGRLVSALATAALVPLVAALVLTAVRRPWSPSQLAVALAMGLLVPCLHAVRNWAVLMRVDMLAIALALLGLLVGMRAAGRFRGTTLSLLICTAAVFTKQTELPAGIAVFLVALLCNPRGAIGAALVAGGIGVAAVLALQWATGGGFLLNIVGYNLNTFALEKVGQVAWNERSSAPFALAIGLAAVLVLIGLGGFPGGFRGWRGADQVRAARAMLLLDLALAALLLVNVAKNGSSFNYFIDSLAVGCVVVGVAMCEPRPASPAFAALVLLLLAGVANLPFRQLPDADLAARAATLRPLAARIAAADQPVASEDMGLVLRAGKSLTYEPAIVQELVATGRWDPAPLLDMVRSGGFAFMITLQPQRAMGGQALTDAMLEAYPRVQPAAPSLWLHLKPE